MNTLSPYSKMNGWGQRIYVINSAAEDKYGQKNTLADDKYDQMETLANNK